MTGLTKQQEEKIKDLLSQMTLEEKIGQLNQESVSIVGGFDVPFEELIEMMRSEGVVEKGHIQLNKNVIIALTDLHLRLLKSPKEMVYGAAYYKTLPYIVQLRAKSGGEELPELETCFNAIYGYLVLRMKGEKISDETMEAIRQISAFLALLAEKYRADMNGELELED